MKLKVKKYGKILDLWNLLCLVGGDSTGISHLIYIQCIYIYYLKLTDANSLISSSSNFAAVSVQYTYMSTYTILHLEHAHGVHQME